MNWRNLGNAILVAFCLFAFIILICLACQFFPMASLIVVFVGVTALIYLMMDKGDGDKDEEEEE